MLGSHAGGSEQRQRVSREAFHGAVEIQEALAQHGFPKGILTGGSTGTWQIDTLLPEVTELQAGSYALMDLAYRRVGLGFLQALTVMATVVSANHDGFVTVDAGYKALSTDRGYGPKALSLAASEYRWGGDEFGYLDVEPANRPQLGARIEFIPPHCDPTVKRAAAEPR